MKPFCKFLQIKVLSNFLLHLGEQEITDAELKISGPPIRTNDAGKTDQKTSKYMSQNKENHTPYS